MLSMSLNYTNNHNDGHKQPESRRTAAASHLFFKSPRMRIPVEHPAASVRISLDATLLKFSSRLDASVTHSPATTSRGATVLLNWKKWNINTPPLACVHWPSMCGRTEKVVACGTRRGGLFNTVPQGEILQPFQQSVGAAGGLISKRCQSWDFMGGRPSDCLLGRSLMAAHVEPRGWTSRISWNSRSACVNKHRRRAAGSSAPSA